MIRKRLVWGIFLNFFLGLLLIIALIEPAPPESRQDREERDVEDEEEDGSEVRSKFLQSLQGSESAPFVQLCHLQTCHQIVSGRNLTYSRALEIIQDEEYLHAASVEIKASTKQRRRVKRGAHTTPYVVPHEITSSKTKSADKLLKESKVYMEISYQHNMMRNPKIALTAKLPKSHEALELLPDGTTAISTFPPYMYNRPRSLNANTVLFRDGVGSSVAIKDGEEFSQEVFGFRTRLTVAEDQPCDLKTTCHFFAAGESGQDVDTGGKLFGEPEFASEAPPACDVTPNPAGCVKIYPAEP